VQNVSKYERDFRGYPAGNRADNMTTYELLSEGMNRKNYPLWRGSGVCRNIACNVKAVFEALKDTQGELSMLRNTYSVYSGGWNGAGYNDKRAEESYAPERRRGGHAWNKFVTVGEDGSAVVTVVDATWALENSIDSAVQHLDYAELRSTPLIIDLLKKSESRAEALGGLNEYMRKLSSSKGVRSRLDIDRREQLWQYITTEYINAMESVLKSPEGLPNDFVLPLEIGAGVMSMAGKLNPNEIETLFPLYESNGSLGRDGMMRLIRVYDREREKSKSLRRWSPEMMVFKNDELQALAFEAVGEDRVNQMAETSVKFRMRRSDLRRKGAV
jgi:hypothetical protein